MQTDVDIVQLAIVRAYGTQRVLIRLQSTIEDIVNAANDGDLDHVILLAYQAVPIALSVKSLANGGELSWELDDILFDPFETLNEALVADALHLAALATELGGGIGSDVQAWLDSLLDLCKDAETIATGGARMQELRSSQGLWKSLRFLREWTSVVEKIGLPSALPEWMSTGWSGDPLFPGHDPMEL